MRISNEEIDKAFGPANAEQPKGQIGSTVAAIGKLDDQMAGFVEKVRQPTETHAQAYARMLSEQPDIYDRYMTKKRSIMDGNGMAGGVE